MDCIYLPGQRYYGYTGALPEEQILGQWFQVDLKLWLDLEPAIQTDDLNQALDYRDVIAQIRYLFTSQRFTLVETLAGEIAALGLGFPQVQAVEVHLTKLAPPIPDYTGQITIQICRNRTAPPQA
ncbi:dihydroneopterin aldolase [Thermosynechococcaceae cyanobacterium BACA0444]|uniref:7,8-dihydroneopterin aldolase n=1 Tax=Pseudocalidococcus azoricus BACA0444 TaxID=2918990 RepID=A0AAE4FRI2_9CYAN|nr:dihydroneopterin aldolase [Pseudocalidococcus azoricus]MDS3859937.1 dihydroneopterin aldolase [Pseudocalidococcus azoricus BACA0444]